MIKEAYCSFEVSKFLKEKGFKEECEYFYDWYEESESYHICSNGGTCNSETYPDEYSMPTHQMAMTWLREVHSLCISIYYLWPCGYEIDIYRIGKDTPINEFEDIREHAYGTYEEAVEAALKYCLEKIIK